MPAVGKQNTTRSTNFTQPGKGFLEVPCTGGHVLDRSHRQKIIRLYDVRVHIQLVMSLIEVIA